MELIMKSLVFMTLMFVLSMICVITNFFKPNDLLPPFSFGLFLIGALVPIFVKIHKGEFKIQVD